MGILKAILTVGDESEDESAATPEEISKQKLEAALDRIIAERNQPGPPVVVPPGSGSMLMSMDMRRSDGSTATVSEAKTAESRPVSSTPLRSGGFGRRTQRPA